MWLGLGLILGLFALADFVSLRAANRVDVTLQTLASSADERRGAGYNMRGDLAAIVRAVQDYVKQPESQQRLPLSKSERAFEQALASYDSLTSTERSEALGEELTRAYAALKRKGHETMRLNDSKVRALDSLAAHQRKVEGLINSIPLVVVAARQAPSMQRRAQVKELEGELRAVTQDLTTRMQTKGERLTEELARDRGLFATSLARYEKFAETPPSGLGRKQQAIGTLKRPGKSMQSWRPNSCNSAPSLNLWLPPESWTIYSRGAFNLPPELNSPLPLRKPPRSRTNPIS
jgi:hypothetical protein